jgi:hypothetical protein
MYWTTPLDDHDHLVVEFTTTCVVADFGYPVWASYVLVFFVIYNFILIKSNESLTIFSITMLTYLYTLFYHIISNTEIKRRRTNIYINTCLIIIRYYIYVCRIKREMINWTGCLETLNYYRNIDLKSLYICNIQLE